MPDWPVRFKELAEKSRDQRLKRYYRHGVTDADTPVSEVQFLAMDFETTGLNPAEHSIVSVGLVPFDIQRIRCRQARHWIVNPSKPLVEESVVIHGITHEDIRQAPDLIHVLEPLLEMMQGRVLVVHHRGIERAFLDEALRKRLKEGIEFPVIDTMELEARLHRTKPLSFWDQLRGRKPASIRLGDSRARYGLPHYAAHQALTDALATAELLQAQIAYHCTPDMPVSKLWW